MNFKFSPNLFLEVFELQRLKESLDHNGFRKVLQQETTSFGLVKNHTIDSNFQNGRVLQDSTQNGNNTILINPLIGLDNSLNILYSEMSERHIPIPTLNEWYWVRISHSYTHKEKGVFSISSTGDLIGSNSELLKILRGQPNFPTKIKFTNSTYNLLEYEVLEVIDDGLAIIQHPPVSINNNTPSFKPEDNLGLEIIGTFTPGVPVPELDKKIIEYDHYSYQLVKELVSNTRPTYINGKEFFLARVKDDGTELVIQDQRLDYWSTKPSTQLSYIDNTPNPLFGVESLKHQYISQTGDSSMATISWGFSSSNWEINSSLNILTINSGSGGKFKSIAQFTDGDFNGWRVYHGNGKFSKILSSYKTGSSINLILDVLRVSNYSSDGDLNLIPQTLTIVPDYEEVIVYIEPILETFKYGEVSQYTPTPIQSGKLQVPLLYYLLDDTSGYRIYYQGRNHKTYTERHELSQDSVNGYLNELSFDSKGGLVTPNYTTYSGSVIQPLPNPNSLQLFKDSVSRGNRLGVGVIEYESNPSPTPLYVELTPGEDFVHQVLTGPIVLDTTTYVINLSTNGATNGTYFRVDVDLLSSTPTQDGNKFVFTTGYDGVGPVPNDKILLELKREVHIRSTGGSRISSPNLYIVYDGSSWRLSYDVSISETFLDRLLLINGKMDKVQPSPKNVSVNLTAGYNLGVSNAQYQILQYGRGVLVGWVDQLVNQIYDNGDPLINLFTIPNLLPHTQSFLVPAINTNDKVERVLVITAIPVPANNHTLFVLDFDETQVPLPFQLTVGCKISLDGVTFKL